MPAPFVIAQLSDPHIGATWAQADPVAGLSAVVAAAQAISPDLVLVSGDLADHATDAEYEQVRALLGPLQAPVYVLPGNHDQRAVLRRHFDLPGTDGEPVQYAVDTAAVRLLVLDTTRPGEDTGELDGERLSWLEAELSATAGVPALLAMHHPPFLCGIPAMDALSLPLVDRHALAELIRRHPHVCGTVAGHIHRASVARVGDRPALAAPSTYVQAELDLVSQELAFTAEPPGFAIHLVLDGELVSHVLPVP